MESMVPKGMSARKIAVVAVPLLMVLFAVGVSASAAPHLTLDAGLVQEAGVDFVADPTGLRLRVAVDSTSRLRRLVVTLNGRDVTDVALRSGHITLDANGRSGELVIDRLPLVAVGLAATAEQRLEVTVEDEGGATTLGAFLAAAGAATPFVTLDRGTNSGIRTPLRQIVRDAASWAALWRRHAATPPPSVDFLTQSVLAVVQGERPTGGHAVEIVAMQRSEASQLLVLVQETAPGPDDIVTQALTSPYHFVAIPRWDGAVVFRTTGPPTP